jgi:hypothetical protein
VARGAQGPGQRNRRAHRKPGADRAARRQLRTASDPAGVRPRQHAPGRKLRPRAGAAEPDRRGRHEPDQHLRAGPRRRRRATGSIDFVQAGNAFPRLDASLAIRNFTRTTAASVSRPLDVNLVARLAPGTGTLNAVMRTRGTVVGRVQAAIQPLGSGSWTSRIAGAPLRGGIRYIGPADALFSLAGLPTRALPDRSASRPTSAGGSSGRACRAWSAAATSPTPTRPTARASPTWRCRAASPASGCRSTS